MKLKNELSKRIGENLKDFDAALDEFINSISLSKPWIEYAWPLSADNPAHPLLTGAKIALAEAGTAWAIGSNRGAAASLRTYIEDAIAWLYYKDHPVEYKVMARHQEDLILPKATRLYLQKMDAGYEKAYALLAASAARTSDYYYSEISLFVHAHPAFAELSNNMAQLVISRPRDPSFLKICGFADEFISDCYVTYYRQSWDVIPDVVKANVQNRLKTKLVKFLET